MHAAQVHALVFPGPCKAARSLLEAKLGRSFNGLGAAASALAKEFGSSTVLNKVTRMARDLQVATALERHFTELGTEQWMHTFSRDLAKIGAAVDSDTLGSSRGGSSSSECSSVVLDATLARRIGALERVGCDSRLRAVEQKLCNIEFYLS